MRLSPLPADQWDDAARHAVSGMLPEERRNPRDAGNVLSTLVR
ncbi:MAG: carboxymuconolactone decarboxylase family protein, partial [Mycobacterium sp.]